MFGVPSSVMPMSATLAPLNFATRDQVEERPAPFVHNVRREELEVGSGEAVAVETAVSRVASTPLHPQELLRSSLVELVVSDRVQVEPDHVHGLDRRLVMEQARQQRARSDEVAGGYDDGVSVRLLQGANVCGQVLGATERSPCRRGRSNRPAAGRSRESRSERESEPRPWIRR